MVSCKTKDMNWKKIESAEGYEVSEEGDVRSIDRVVVSSNGVERFLKGKIISPMDHNRVKVSVGGKRKILRIDKIM